jgi:uncharacterized protein
MISIAPHSDHPPTLLIVGASTRAAAFSALRAGWHPVCLDRFADADLQSRAVVQRIAPYPKGLNEAVQAIPPCPAIYVGGLENSPETVQVLSRCHELWGNSGEALSGSRDPRRVAETLKLGQVNVPEWRDADDPPPRDGNWLIRPLNGTGGRGIRVWSEETAGEATLGEPHGFQRRIEGTSCSAVFVAPEEAGDIRFVGVTRQLIGEAACHAAPFQWCGNIGPVSLSIPVEHLIRRAGNVLKWKLGLRGIFGVDFIVDADDVPWVTEVNPRYPASAELLEFATGDALLAAHARCFSELIPDLPDRIVPPEEAYLGKAILYAPHPITVSDELASGNGDPLFRFPDRADLPAPGETFAPGDPVCTLFATGSSVERCWERLQEQLQSVERSLDPNHPAPGA